MKAYLKTFEDDLIKEEERRISDQRTIGESYITAQMQTMALFAIANAIETLAENLK